MRTTLRVLALLVLVRSLSASEIQFAHKPTVVKEGAVSRVRFELSASTDVEVSILSAAGKVVRHLAAGMLGGKNPPPEPLKPGLGQDLAWDGKDDFGVAAAGGPFKVQVRAGTSVKFGRIIGGDDPYVFGAVGSLVTDENGLLYLLACSGRGGHSLRVFSPEGKYLRTIAPFPASLPPESVSEIASWDALKNTFHPKNRTMLFPEFYGWGKYPRIVSASVKNGIQIVVGMQIFRLDVNGGNLKAPVPMWSPAAKLNNYALNAPQLAVTADGHYMYYANVAGSDYDFKHPSQIDPKWPNGRVYRQDLTKPGSDPEKFFDLELPDWEKQKYWMPNGWNCRTAAFHILVDSNGHLHIGDLVNQEIVEVDASGKKLGATKVATPESFTLDEKSGAYYVFSRTVPLTAQAEDVPLELVKSVGRGAQAKVAAKLALKEISVRGGLGMAMVKSQDSVRFWIASGRKLSCIADKGSALEYIETEFKSKPDSQEEWIRFSTDYERDEIYTNCGMNSLRRYDGSTGKCELLMRDGKPMLGTDIAVGYDGLLYARTGPSFSGPLERLDRDLKPVPFASGTNTIMPGVYSRFGVTAGNCEKGLGVGPKGECYVSSMYGWTQYFLAGFGPDGNPMEGKYLLGKIPEKLENSLKPKDLNSAIVGPLPVDNGGVRVDLKGNIYVGMCGLPKDHPVPAGFETDPAYNTWTGSIVKFLPAGGTVLGAVPKDEPANAEGVRLQLMSTRGPKTIVGATAAYPGLAPFSGAGFGDPNAGESCVCRVPRFDVDRFGRLVLPNAVTNSVTLQDNAGNTILEFGAYGNFDSLFVNPNLKEGQEGQPTVKVPAIPLGWPIGAGFTRGHIYVNDAMNRRVVRVDLRYTIEDMCEIK